MTTNDMKVLQELLITEIVRLLKIIFSILILINFFLLYNYFKEVFILKNKMIIIITSILLVLLSYDNANAQETARPENLKYKGDLNKNLLLHVKDVYSDYDKKVDINGTKNTSQILSNDLTFDNINVPGGGNSLRIEFKDNNIANIFKDKNVDIYGMNYYYKCVGESGKNSSCMYGGVTLNNNNTSKETISIGMNVFIDGVKQKTEVIQTNKEQVTVQEIDIKARSVINKKYEIYSIYKNNINYGIIDFHNNLEKDKSFYYDLFNFEGEHKYKFLEFYNDNKIITARDYHIDVYLYS